MNQKEEFMKQYIGECFEGVISGITTWGMYVELPNTVEGMVHVNSMEGDYYFYDEEHYMMIGEHTKKMYKLGQKVTIEVVGCDRVLRTIDFKLVESDSDIEEDMHDEIDEKAIMDLVHKDITVGDTNTL